MAEKLSPTWRDGVSERLGAIERGVKDLGRNFDDFKKVFDGNGQPGRCQLAVAAREKLAERVRVLEDAHERRAWVGVLGGLVRAVASVIAAAILLALLHHWFGWMK